MYPSTIWRWVQRFVPEFEKRNNCRVNLSILNIRALDVRLMQSFMADPTSDDLRVLSVRISDVRVE